MKATITQRQGFWMEGTVSASGTEYTFAIKRYEEPSKYGIDNGRISKLEVRQDGRIIVNYDRGWDIWPTSNDAAAITASIMETYN